jgi:hypothetical protein
MESMVNQLRGFVSCTLKHWREDGRAGRLGVHLLVQMTIRQE